MLSEEVKTAYDNFYTNSDVAWRMLGAKYKAQNIIDVCKGLKPKKVLEVGAGDGSILHFLNEWHFTPELYALEIAQSGVDIIKDLLSVSAVFKAVVLFNTTNSELNVAGWVSRY